MSEEKTGGRRGKLKIFLGYAPGVGKTYAMLSQASRIYNRGRDVIVGYFECHGRADTMKLLEGLPKIPAKKVCHGGVCLFEMDTDAIIERHPEIALVDELAHTNAPGSKNPKRYQDVEELLEAGIDVHTTVNLQHLESLNDVIHRITGVTVRETLPDRVLDQADEVVVIDIQPEALRNRMKRGVIYGPEKAEDALSNFFRPGNLNALRELALRKAADHVDVELTAYRKIHHINDNWHTTEKLLVAITAEESSQRLIRVAARLNQRLKGEFYVVHVKCTHWMADRETETSREVLRRSFSLAEDLGAECVTLEGKSVSAELMKFARSRGITKFVIGHTHRGRLKTLIRGSTINKFIDGCDDVQVIVTPMDAF